MSSVNNLFAILVKYILTYLYIHANIDEDIILFFGGKMNTQIHGMVLKILAQYRTKFVPTSDIIKEVLKTQGVKFVVHELTSRGHAYGIKANATEKEINEFINNSYPT